MKTLCRLLLPVKRYNSTVPLPTVKFQCRTLYAEFHHTSFVKARSISRHVSKTTFRDAATVLQYSSRMGKRGLTTAPVDTDLIARISAHGPDNGKVPCAHFDQTGKFISEKVELTKDQIGAQFELRHRDLRDIDLKSEAVNRILVRPATILLQFFDLCVIIQSNGSLLIDLRHSEDRRNVDFYHQFRRRLSGSGEVGDLPELPYELRAVETALIVVLSSLREELLEAQQGVDQNVEHLDFENGVDAFDLDLLFEQSRRLERIEQKARSVRQTIREVLDTDEDLAGMYLSDREAGRPHEISDHQEAEYMLEAYHKIADGFVESSQRVISIIRQNESLFRASLAVQRNRIMFLEARIAIHTLGLAAGTLVAGLFGMNLVNYFEESPYGFAVVTGICIMLSSIFSAYGMRSIRQIKALRGNSHPNLKRPGHRH